MHSSTVGFYWELWRRRRRPLLTIVGVILAFAFVYPKLCALADFNLGNTDPLDEMGKRMSAGHVIRPSLGGMIQVLYLLFLAVGPGMAMFVTLLMAIWVFTFTEVDPKTKDPMRFPTRVFTLPISTPFVFWHLLLGGAAVVTAVQASWVFIFPPPPWNVLLLYPAETRYAHLYPRLDLFGFHQSFLAWLTLLAAAQAVSWALASWPNIRTIVLAAALMGWLNSASERPILLPLILLVSLPVARLGLEKLRHGQWQTWPWRWPFTASGARLAAAGSKPFASRGSAQLWFEWHRFAWQLCYTTAFAVLVPVACLLLARVFGFGKISDQSVIAIAGSLACVPLLVHFCHGASLHQTDQPFLMVRPLTNGEIVMAMLKRAAVSTLITWAAVLAAIGAMTTQDLFLPLVRHELFSKYATAVFLGLFFLTWRVAVQNLCFVLPGSRRLASIPVYLTLGLIAIPALTILKEHAAYWELFLRLVPLLLAILLAVKFVLAFVAFRASLRRRLLDLPSLTGYLALWGLIAVALMATVFLSHLDKELDVPALWVILGTILLVPLARIGFCPIALDRYRHA